MEREYNELAGTRTNRNIMKAFEAECKANMKYKLFADESEYQIIEKIFLETASNEEEHAEVFLEMVGGIGSDLENLRRSIALEAFESDIDYPEMARTAREEGFEDIALKFEYVGRIEHMHKERFQKAYDLLSKDKLYKRDKKVCWECMKCGYVHEGVTAPEECPFCGHDQDHFMIKGGNI